MAKENHHIQWLFEGCDRWNMRRREKGFTPDFSGEDLYRHFSDADKLTSDGHIPLAEFDLHDANFSNSRLSNPFSPASADLRDADLRSADFSRANLPNADLAGADLREAAFGHADMRNADLKGASLPYRFYKVILSSVHRRCPLSRKSHEIGQFLSIQQIHLRAFGSVSQAHYR